MRRKACTGRGKGQQLKGDALKPSSNRNTNKNAVAEWLPVASWPAAQGRSFEGNPLMLNSNEFVISCADGHLVKYNIFRIEWTPFLKVPEIAKYLGPDPAMLIDAKNNRIFLSPKAPAPGMQNTIVVDLLDGSVLQRTFECYLDSESIQARYDNAKKYRSDFYQGLELVNVNGIVHKMGGDDDRGPSGHMTWNETTNAWNFNGELAPFNKIFTYSSEVQISVVFVPTKDVVLMFCSSNYRVGICRYLIKEPGIMPC